jgi:hypothetical protein
LVAAPCCAALQFPKEDYAGEMHLLLGLQREQVVANCRSISHAMHKWVPQYEGVLPHQVLPGLYEARLYHAALPGGSPTTYEVSNSQGGAGRHNTLLL